VQDSGGARGFQRAARIVIDCSKPAAHRDHGKALQVNDRPANAATTVSAVTPDASEPSAASTSIDQGLDELRRAMQGLEPSVRDWSLSAA